MTFEKTAAYFQKFVPFKNYSGWALHHADDWQDLADSHQRIELNGIHGPLPRQGLMQPLLQYS